ncbi:hypothetical protein COO60DRAFT_276781 [Scenedesmus sp. NREL 46B-D3]|nr:hypothetical protein COO60DRAFT_276781 [Scenedesmus sp. NREL 46B-D3]
MASQPLLAPTIPTAVVGGTSGVHSSSSSSASSSSASKATNAATSVCTQHTMMVCAGTMSRSGQRSTGPPAWKHPTEPSKCTSAAALSWALHPRCQMQITFTGPPPKLRNILQRIGIAGLVDKSSSTADHIAGASIAAAAAPDSGCDPNIMTCAQADASQIYYRPLKEASPAAAQVRVLMKKVLMKKTPPSWAPAQAAPALSCTSASHGSLRMCTAACHPAAGSMGASWRGVEAPYQDKGTLYYRLGRIHHSARNFFGYRDTIKWVHVARPALNNYSRPNPLPGSATVQHAFSLPQDIRQLTTATCSMLAQALRSTHGWWWQDGPAKTSIKQAQAQDCKLHKLSGQPTTPAASPWALDGTLKK